MAINVAQLLVKLNADTTNAEVGLLRVSKMLGPGGVLAMPVLLTTAAVAGIGVVATVMAGKFQASMVQLVTGAGESRKNLQLVTDGILAMAEQTGTSTKQLADGMFMIESAGFHGADGLNVLKAAAEGAKVGNADLGTVADAVTTVMVDYGLKSNQAAIATNVLIATVANGKTHMQDLAGAVAHILPAAAAAHIGLNDIMGAMAALTGQGIDAANAATYLRQMVIALNAPSGEAKKALAAVGLTSDQVAAAMRTSLPAALQLIQDHLKQHYKEGSPEYVAAIKNISGGLREMQGMLALTGPHLATFKTDTDNITNAVKKGGNSVTGWSDVQKTLNFQFDRAKAVAETLMIQLGTKLLPAATALFAYFANNAIPTISNFVKWISGSSVGATAFKVVLIAVGGAIAGILVTAFVSWAIAAGAAAIATIAATWPVLAIGAGIALLTAGIILLVSHWKQISGWLSGVWKGVTAEVQLGLQGLTAWMAQLGVGMMVSIKGGLNNVIGAINGFIRFIDSIQIHIPAIGVGPVKSPAFNWNGLGIGQIPYLAEGGDVLRAGLAVVGERGPELVSLTRGAQVAPLGAGGGGGGQQTIIVQLDGRTIAQATVKHLPEVIRLATGKRSF